MATGRAPENDLLSRLRAATDSCKRYGWGFTLVMLLLDAADEQSDAQIESHLRARDTLVKIGTREYAILLPAAGGDEVPRLLARVGRDGAVSTFCYGLAACPGDETDPEALLVLATARLHEAKDLRVVHRNILQTDDQVWKIAELPLELLVGRGLVAGLHNERAEKQ